MTYALLQSAFTVRIYAKRTDSNIIRKIVEIEAMPALTIRALKPN